MSLSLLVGTTVVYTNIYCKFCNMPVYTSYRPLCYPIQRFTYPDTPDRSFVAVIDFRLMSDILGTSNAKTEKRIEKCDRHLVQYPSKVIKFSFAIN